VIEHKLDRSKKVCIVGFASSSRDKAPFDDRSWEIWGLNSLYMLIPDVWTRWYEIHPREHFVKDLNRAELKQVGADHYEWLKAQPGPGHEKYRPIYMQDTYPEIPASVRWPRREINEWTRRTFGNVEIDYFTSTPGEMLVQAIMEGYGTIMLCGIDMMESGEYAYQRPGVEYWVGVARGLGAEVIIPTSSALCKASYVYGYTEPPVEHGKIAPLATFFEEQANKLHQEQIRVSGIVNVLNGGVQAFNALRERIINARNAQQVRAMLPGEVTGEQPPAAPTDAEILSSLLQFIEERLVAGNQQIQVGMNAIEKMNGTREGLASAKVFTEHFGRGGKLDGMVDWHQSASTDSGSVSFPNAEPPAVIPFVKP